MSKLSCPVVKVEFLEPIDGADRVELAFALGYDVIVEKGQFHAGDMAVLIPPDCVLPDSLARSLKGKSKLFGERKNRTKAFTLKGVASHGILLGPLPDAVVGTECAAMLGITKHQEASTPYMMQGESIRVKDLTIAFDLENFRRWPKIILENEEVEITEKVHGTCCGVSFVPGLRRPDFIGGDTFVYSKKHGAKGYVLTDTSANVDNVYVRTAKRLGLRETMIHTFGTRSQVTIFGEIYGAGVQDLSYGEQNQKFTLFDVYLGSPRKGRFLNRDELSRLKGELNYAIPILYEGPFKRDMLRKLASGQTVIGEAAHMREGVVIRPVADRYHPQVGRVILKYVSPEYLSRADGTEHT